MNFPNGKRMSIIQISIFCLNEQHVTCNISLLIYKNKRETERSNDPNWSLQTDVIHLRRAQFSYLNWKSNSVSKYPEEPSYLLMFALTKQLFRPLQFLNKYVIIEVQKYGKMFSNLGNIFNNTTYPYSFLHRCLQYTECLYERLFSTLLEVIPPTLSNYPSHVPTTDLFFSAPGIR